MTTHNTLLMESDIPKESIYVINELQSGEKEIQCILHYNNKIGEKNNIRRQYLFGKYSGIPEETSIDFQSLLSTLKTNKATMWTVALFLSMYDIHFWTKPLALIFKFFVDQFF